MKVTFAIIITVSLLIGFYSHTYEASQAKENDLVEIKEIMDENNVSVSSWMVYKREKIGESANQEEMMEKVKSIISNKSDYEWRLVVEEAGHHYVWQGIKKENDHKISEIIKLKSYLSDGKFTISQTYEVKGTELMKEQVGWVKEAFHNDDKNVFYTVKGKLKAKDKKVYTEATKIVNDFQGTIIEQLREPTFVSISAYSELFESGLLTKDREKMNVQIGLRMNQRKNEIDVTIGTPIITTEY